MSEKALTEKEKSIADRAERDGITKAAAALDIANEKAQAEQTKEK